MTAAQPDLSPRFVRRTQLTANEYRRNFRQLDEDAISAVTSGEADRVTPLMSKIYLRLVSAPAGFWEREGVLYFAAGEQDSQPVKASKVLYEVLGVASATAHKALRWMHEQGIIGYFAGKNGAGIRIFINRAVGSIGVRDAAAGKKILPFARGSNGAGRGSAVEPAFNDSFADPEVLDTDFDPRAPKDGAEQTEVVKKYTDPHPASLRPVTQDVGVEVTPPATLRVEVPVSEIVSRLSRELEPALQSAARQAAAREHERTREWLESRGLPKAARVAQREAYNVLRRYGVVKDTAQSSPPAEVGRGNYVPEGHQPLSEGEVEELAQACIAMLEIKGQSIELTLSEMSTEAGGFLLPSDAPRVRAKAEAFLYTARESQW